MFDFIVEQLLELIRQAIYRRAKRPLPAPGEAARGKMPAARTKVTVEVRRRTFNPLGNPLVLGLTLLLAFLVFRRMFRR